MSDIYRTLIEKYGKDNANVLITGGFINFNPDMQQGFLTLDFYAKGKEDFPYGDFLFRFDVFKYKTLDNYFKTCPIALSPNFPIKLEKANFVEANLWRNMGANTIIYHQNI